MAVSLAVRVGLERLHSLYSSELPLCYEQTPQQFCPVRLLSPPAQYMDATPHTSRQQYVPPCATAPPAGAILYSPCLSIPLGCAEKVPIHYSLLYAILLLFAGA